MMPRRNTARTQAGSTDIDNLARFLEEIDPKRYFDRQAEDAWRSAARRWPMLAEVLRLGDEEDGRS